MTINISSPNTEGLRDLHDENSLEKAIKKFSDFKKQKNAQVPIVVKYLQILTIKM